MHTNVYVFVLVHGCLCTISEQWETQCTLCFYLVLFLSKGAVGSSSCKESHSHNASRQERQRIDYCSRESRFTPTLCINMEGEGNDIMERLDEEDKEKDTFIVYESSVKQVLVKRDGCSEFFCMRSRRKCGGNPVWRPLTSQRELDFWKCSRDRTISTFVSKR